MQRQSDMNDDEEECLCTYCLSGSTLIHQEIFTCETCNARNDRGVLCFCSGCAEVCHAGHATRAIAFGQAYCDCGAANCQLKQLTQTRMLAATACDVKAEGVQEEVAAAVKAMQYHGDKRTTLAVAPDRTPFSVHEVVPLAISVSSPDTTSNAAADVFGTLRKECIAVLKESKETFWVGSDWMYSFDESKAATVSSTTNGETTAAARKQSCCQLEDFALMIFHYHTQALASEGIEVDPSTSGAEWWIQVKNSYEDSDSSKLEGKEVGGLKTDAEADRETENDQTICLHYDKDEDAAEKWAVGLFPPLSTVTYLSAPSPSSMHPQPTLVFKATANDTVGSPICDAYLSFPRIGKHIAFDGNLLHGAPAHPSLCTWRHQLQQETTKSEINSKVEGKNKDDGNGGDESALRVTFLVNIWLNHHPLGVKVLGEDIAKGLRQPLASSSNDLDLDQVDLGTLQVSFPPPAPPGAASGVADINALSVACKEDKEKVDQDSRTVAFPLTALLSLQAHGGSSTHTVAVRSEEAFQEELAEDRDEGVAEEDVLLRGGYEQLCLPFITSKSTQSSSASGGPDSDEKEGGDKADSLIRKCAEKSDDNEEEDDSEGDSCDEAGLIVRMILPPCPSAAPPLSVSSTSLCMDIPIDSFHFVYCDELCAPTLEYEYDEDYEDEDDDDDEDDEEDDEDYDDEDNEEENQDELEAGER